MSQILSVIEVWAAVAWADGVLAEQEAAGLRKLIAAAELSPDERDTANGFLTTRIELPPSKLGDLPVDTRTGIYRNACRMAGLDHVFADAERSLLDRLRVALAMPIQVADDIEVALSEDELPLATPTPR